MELEVCKRKAVAMLRGYRENEVYIRMVEADLQALEQMENYNCNMAVSYDQPSSGVTNKVISPVETELLQKEQKREKLEKILLQRRTRKKRIDMALENMPYTQQMLLRLHYIEDVPWIEVADAVNYAEYYVKKELKERAILTLTYYLYPELSHVNLFAEKECVTEKQTAR